MDAGTWFYARNGQQTGPVTLEQLVELARSGQVVAQDLVWTAGMPQWQPAGSTAALAGVFAPQVPSSALPEAIPMASTHPGCYGPAGSLEYGRPIVYAGFWLRFVAYIIDSLVTSAGGCIGGGLVGGVIGGIMGAQHAPLQDIQVVSQIMGSILGTVISWLYSALMESSQLQATLGKMALGLKVTTLDGQRISFGRATGRYFGKILSTLILCIGFMMAGFTEKKQALHDMLAGTLVVKK